MAGKHALVLLAALLAILVQCATASRNEDEQAALTVPAPVAHSADDPDPQDPQDSQDAEGSGVGVSINGVSINATLGAARTLKDGKSSSKERLIGAVNEAYDFLDDEERLAYLEYCAGTEVVAYIRKAQLAKKSFHVALEWLHYMEAGQLGWIPYMLGKEAIHVHNDAEEKVQVRLDKDIFTDKKGTDLAPGKGDKYGRNGPTSVWIEGVNVGKLVPNCTYDVMTTPKGELTLFMAGHEPRCRVAPVPGAPVGSAASNVSVPITTTTTTPPKSVEPCKSSAPRRMLGGIAFLVVAVALAAVALVL